MPTTHADYAKALPGRPSGQKFYLHAPCFIVPLTLPIAQNSDSLDGYSGKAATWSMASARGLVGVVLSPLLPPKKRINRVLRLKSNCKGATTETEKAAG